VPLSEEARQRFALVLDQTDLSNTNPDDDAALLDFVAWALIHQPDALRESFALESMMSERGLTDSRMRYVLIILRVAVPLVAAYGAERDASAATRPEPPPEGEPAHGG
jgi:hypothetical protein